MKDALKVTVLSSVMAMTGCSTIIHGTDDTLSVRTLDMDTTLYVDGAPVGKGGASFSAQRGQDYVLEARKEGCMVGSVTTSSSFDPTTILGIFLDFGIFSIPTDLISGAAFKPSQKVYTVAPICN